MLRWRKRIGWIGVDVGTRSVKLAQVERDGAEVRLLHGIAIPRTQPWPAFESPLQSSPRSSREEIHAGMLLAERMSGRSAACVLPMSVQEFRALHIPDGTPEQRRNMIASELDEVNDMDQWQFDYWDTDQSNAGSGKGNKHENVNVLLVAKSWTEQIARDAKRSRLTCKAIDGVPFTLSRASQMIRADRGNDPVATIDWGYRSTTLTIAIDGTPVYTRLLRDCHLGHGIELASRSMGISMAAAEEIFFREGEAESFSVETNCVVHRAIDDLADELEKTFNYLRSQRPKLAPNCVWIFGGGGSIDAAPERLSNRLGHCVQRWPGPDREQAGGNGSCPPALLASAMSLSALAFEF